MSENLLPPIGPNSREEDRRRWALVWFNQLVRFHQVQDRSKWKFGQNVAIDYLESQRDSGMPAWKRLKIVEGLICYSQLHPGVLDGSLESVRIKFTEMVAGCGSARCWDYG